MITKVRLTDFRNFHSKVLDFSEKISIIVGPNASGKTNILESLFLLSTGRSFKARLEAEVIRYEQELARVEGAISYMPNAIRSKDNTAYSMKHNTKLEAIITKGDNGWPRKKLTVNGISRRLIDFAGNFKVVLFGPWDMDLVTESPSIRRKFLDTVLSQVDREYRRSMLSYEKGLRQRNKLLFRIREEGIPRSQLLFWNQLLIKNGDYISAKRQEFIGFVNEQPSLNDQKFNLEYDYSMISEGRLNEYAEEEIAAATTLVGPHRDDFVFEIRNPKSETRNLASYGSRGEQRMGVLWIKMAELDYIERCSLVDSTPSAQSLSSLTIRRSLDFRPTLLLDDIFSELDHEHRDVVIELAKKQQTIITTADKHFLKGLKADVIINL